MKNKEPKLLEYRMYFLVNRSMGPINKGCQSIHGTTEYSLKYGNDPDYLKWAKHDKTVVMLDGGSSNDGLQSFYGVPKLIGNMENHIELLRKNKIKYACFKEPDLNWATTAICFLADERVWNKREYKAPEGSEFILWDKWTQEERKEKCDKIIHDYKMENNLHAANSVKNTYLNWLDNIGGKSNEFLRYFVWQFDLAR